MKPFHSYNAATWWNLGCGLLGSYLLGETWSEAIGIFALYEGICVTIEACWRKP